MIRNSKKMKVIFAIIYCTLLITSISAQTTAFKYQGSLTDTGSPAYGIFQMRFRLFDAVSDGTQVGATLTDVPAAAANGVFTVTLDFGSAALSGANRWLEISVRRNSGESYVTLSPREPITSSPYSVRTLSAAMADDSQKLGGIDANQYPTLASNSFIKNDTALQTANFNVSGSGRVGGNFGIGTTAPGSGFEMRGTALSAQQRITDATSNNSLVLQGGAGSNLKVTGFNYTTGTPQPLYLSVDGANTIINPGGGRVGIGTSIPSNTLDVAGSLGITGNATIGTNATIGGNASIGGHISQSAGASGLMKFGLLVNANGTINLCINTQNPANCGVTVSHPATGYYDITFPYQINSRIFSATMALPPDFGQQNIDVFKVRPTGTTTVRVRSSTYGPSVVDADTAFYLAVF